MEKLKVGVVGLRRGSAHVRISRFTRHVLVTAICDVDRAQADRIAREIGMKDVYYDYGEMLTCADIDAVIIASPIPLHVDHVIQALQAGKHVLSEVTCATKLEDLTRLCAAVRASDCKYMLAENYCWIRPMTILRNMINEGLLGEIYYAEGDYIKDFAFRSDFPHIGGWREPTYFGRQGHPYITHSLGPLASYMGEKIKTVVCMGAGREYNLVADNTCALLLKTEKGHMIRLRNSFVSPRPDNYLYYSFQGTKGSYAAPRGPSDFHKIHIKGICAPNEWKNIYDFSGFLPEEWAYPDSLHYSDLQDYDSGTPLMQDAFALAVLNNTPTPVSLEDSVNWTAAGLLSADSLLQGSKPVSVPVF